MKFLTRRVTEWLIPFLSLVVIAMVIGLVSDQVSLTNYDLVWFFNPHPTSTILELNTISAIEIFAGNDAIPYQFDLKTLSIVFNVMLYFIIGPFLLYMGYEKSKDHEDHAKPWYWYPGAMICIIALTVIPATITHFVVVENTHDTVAENRAMDHLRQEAADIGFAIAQYEVLNGGLTEDFTLSSLNMELEYRYTVESISSDTLLVLLGNDPDFEENDIKLEVYPHEKRQIRFRN